MLSCSRPMASSARPSGLATAEETDRLRVMISKSENFTLTAATQAQFEALEKRSRAEDARWEKERERLQSALQRARD